MESEIKGNPALADRKPRCYPKRARRGRLESSSNMSVFDVLARLLRRSYALRYARNVTDVDDKINAAAAAEGVDIGVVTERFLEAFREDMRTLGVLPPDVEPRVTQHMAEIVAFIRQAASSSSKFAREACSDISSSPE